MKKIFSLLSLLAFALGLNAVPAYRGAVKAVQPDGSTITYYVRGDERAHCLVTPDGYIISKASGGYFRYLENANGVAKLTVSSPVVHDLAMRTTAEKNFLGSAVRYDDAVKSARQASSSAKSAPRQASTKAVPYGQMHIGNFPCTGNQKGLIILAQFNDLKFTYSQSYFQRMMNETGFSDDNATGSAADYFKDQSFGKFTPTFDVVGPVTLSRVYSYYGRDESTFFGTTHDVNLGQMISEACTLAHQQGVDFSQYDGDGDDTVDMVYVIYAGYGENFGGDENTIWPQKYQLSAYSTNLTLDGKRIDTFACSSELWGASGTESNGIGTFCHEFGHVLGLADHYNTTNSTDYEFGRYDIMDYGNYNNDARTPAAYTAFERISLGWTEPTIINEPENGLKLDCTPDSGKAYLLTTNNPNEFYLLENRQQKNWDSYIKSSGMMITHVDYDQSAWNSNTVNDEDSHKRLYMVCADNERGYDEYLNKQSEESDLYPIASNNAFTDESTPASTTYGYGNVDKWVTNIQNSDGIVTFDFMTNHLRRPVNLAADNISKEALTLNWDAVDGATEYNVTYNKLDFESDMQVAANEGFQKMTAGTADEPGSDVSDKLDNYMGSTGWTGTNVYQAGGCASIGLSSASGNLAKTFNMSKFGGHFAVALKARSQTGKTPVFTVSANGKQGRYRLTSTMRTYLFVFDNGISATDLNIAVTNGRMIVDSLVILRGADAEAQFPDAKKISVTGKAASTENPAVYDQFLVMDTTVVNGVSTNKLRVNGLVANTYYRFAVQASDGSRTSVYSEVIDTCTNDLANGIAAVEADNRNAENAEYFNIQGMRVNPAKANGIVIVRDNRGTRKLIKE